MKGEERLIMFVEVLKWMHGRFSHKDFKTVARILINWVVEGD